MSGSIDEQTKGENSKESEGGSAVPERRVLLVEDDNRMRALVSEALSFEKRYHYTVHPVPNVTEGISKLNSGNYDLLITDINMPGANGYEMIEATLKKENHPGIIAYTGNPQNAKPQGIDAFLGKPVKMGELLKTAYDVVNLKPKK
jgi:two-component system, OmpR family, response regulator